MPGKAPQKKESARERLTKSAAERSLFPLLGIVGTAAGLLWAIAAYRIDDWMGAAIGAAGTLIGLVIIKRRRWRQTTRLARFGVSFVSLVISLGLMPLALFCLVDIFPGLVNTFRLNHIRYFAFRERFTSDPKLAIRKRPNYRLNVRAFRGDLSGYGRDIPASPLTFVGKYDKLGFRNSNAAYYSDSDVVVLGDSMMEIGHDNDDTFASRLGRAAKMRVLNFGQGWHGPEQYLAILKEYGMPSNPRIIILAFSETNDIRDIQEYHHWKHRGRYYHFMNPPANLYGRLTVAVESARSPRRRHKASRPYLAQLRLRSEIRPVLFRRPAESVDWRTLLHRPPWRRLRSILREAGRISQKGKAKLFAMFIPNKLHVYARLSRSSRWGPSKNKAIANRENRWLHIRSQQIGAVENRERAFARICAQAKVEMMSLSPLFASLADQGELLYYPLDSHWNSIARQAAAMKMAQVITQ